MFQGIVSGEYVVVIGLSNQRTTFREIGYIYPPFLASFLF